MSHSSFTSVSLDPLVSVSVAHTSKTWPDLRRADRFGVAVLADHHGAVTLDEGMVRSTCSLYREVEAGDHVIVLLQVRSVKHGAADHAGDPLLFHRSGFSRLERSA